MSGSRNALLQDDPRYAMGGSDNALAPQPTWADAAQWHAQNLADTWTAMQNPQTWLDAGRQYGNALLMGTTAPGVRAFHGSPYDFERFDTSKIGTGEGAQAYGHGLYFAGNEPTAQFYRDALTTRAPTQFNVGSDVIPEDALAERLRSGFGMPTTFAAKQLLSDVERGRSWDEIRQSSPDKWGPTIDWLQQQGVTAQPRSEGHMYEVNIGADPEHFLHWDKPLSEQSPQVQQALKGIEGLQPNISGNVTGGTIVDNLQNYHGNSAEAAQALRNAGIPGIRYLDQGSRGQGQGTHNYVVFDANTIDILRKYGIAGLIAGGGAAAAGGVDPQLGSGQ